MLVVSDTNDRPLYAGLASILAPSGGSESRPADIAARGEAWAVIAFGRAEPECGQEVASV
jgi:hypothetical protein